jgi:drug/metabolite transporter (DMT)-like permease
MTGYGLSLVSAVSLATADAMTKRYFSHLSPYAMGLSRLLYALPWLALCWPVVPSASPDGVFFLCVAAALPLEVTAFLWYMKAIRMSPLSLCLPFLAFTPVFLLGSGWVILGEMPHPIAILGIMLVVTGSYILYFKETDRGILTPIMSIWTEPGSRLMMGVSMLYAVTSPLGKVAIQHTNPLFFACVYFALVPMVMMILMFFRAFREGNSRLVAPLRTGLPVGFAVAVMVISHMTAISLTDAVLMVSVKRTSLLFGVLYGAIWFKEERIGERLAGALVMSAGIAVIGWWG